jgi:hypothetical protein
MTDKQDRAIKTARDFSRAVSEMSFDADAFADEIRRDHRTIQQSSARVIFTLIEKWGADFDSGNYDLRNEDTCRLCAGIMRRAGKKGFNPRYI